MLLFLIPVSPLALQAQSLSDEFAIREFARNFMAAYNRQDVEALKAMYTTDVVSIVEGSETMVGADYIAQLYAERFTRQEVTLLVKQTSVVWSDAEHALVAKGTYEGFGTTYVYDIPFRKVTAYANTMIKENDQWKIAKSIVTPLAKTMIYQKVSDFAQWKWAMIAVLGAHGVLNYEIGTLNSDPNTAYALLEWPSIEVAKAFFDHPDLKKAMKEINLKKKPTILFLDSE